MTGNTYGRRPWILFPLQESVAKQARGTPCVKCIFSGELCSSHWSSEFFFLFSLFFHRNMSHGISGSAGISHSLPLNSLKLSIIVRSFFRGRGIGANTPDWEFQRSWMESPPEMALKFTAMLPNCENVSRRVCAAFSSLGNVLKHRRLFTASLTRTYIYHKGFIHSREGLWARAAD